MRRAVESVLKQSYLGPVEVIVVFDAEDPYPVDVEVGPARSLVLTRNERTRGLAGGRNSGILKAKHELVAFLDDDDEWREDKLALQVPLMVAEPAMPLSGAGMAVISADGTVERPIDHTPITMADLIRNRIPELNACGIMSRRERLLGDLGLVDESLPGSYGEDYDLLLRAARIHPIAVVNEPVVLVHWHGGSFFVERWRMIADALRYLLGKHPEFDDDPKGKARVLGQIAFAEAALGDKKQARKTARQTLKLNPRERRAVLAYAVSSGIVSAERVLRELRRFGRGI